MSQQDLWKAFDLTRIGAALCLIALAVTSRAPTAQAVLGTFVVTGLLVSAIRRTPATDRAATKPSEEASA